MSSALAVFRDLIRGDKARATVYSKKLKDDNIRLLELYAGRQGDPIKCKLITKSLAAAEEEYEAISYVWGDATDTVEITCNGQKLTITTSLSDALHALRSPQKARLLWADAICINQADNAEKGHQVKRMGKVYENAKTVLVWLGRDPDDLAEGCFQFIREVCQYYISAWEMCKSTHMIPSPPAGHPIHDKQRWTKLKEMARLAWFERLWVVQEAGLARECVLLWGGAQSDFAEIVELAAWSVLRSELGVLERGANLSLVSSNFECVQAALGNTETWRERMPLSRANIRSINRDKRNRLVEVLITGRNLQASDARDHVYGFLGSPLALTPQGALLVEPDYTKPVLEVFVDTACALLLHPREAPWVLLAAQHDAEPSEEPGEKPLPSWVPRWDQKMVSSPIGRPNYWYQAGGPEHGLAVSIQQRRRLAVRGYVIDCLSWTSRRINAYDLHYNAHHWAERYRSKGITCIDELWEQTKQAIQRTTKETGQGLEDAFHLALVRGYPSIRREGFSLPDSRLNIAAYRDRVRHAVDPDQPRNELRIPHLNEKAGNEDQFLRFFAFADNRKLICTREGRLGQAPWAAQAGDIVCIFLGMSVPLILRPTKANRDTYHLIGDSYIHGVMGGEMMAELEKGKFTAKDIILE